MGMTEPRYQAQKGFVHRQVADTDILISVGANVANFNGYIELNPTASFIWDALTQPRTVNELTDMLTEEFDVSREIAFKDVTLLMEMLKQNSMVIVYEDA